MNHEEASLLVADAGASRLAADELRRFEAHTAACAECRGAVATYRLLAAGLTAEPGEHPASEALAQHALAAQGAPASAALQAHLAACAACAGDAADAAAAARSARPAAPTWRVAFPIGLAAGVALAALGPMLRPEPARFQGAAAYVALGEATRGTGGPVVLELPADQPEALLAVQADLRGRSQGSLDFRIEREGGGPGVWRTSMPVATAAQWLERHGAVLLAVPRGALPPSRYRLAVEAGDGPLLLRSFEVR
jgi:hypothetical protein